MDDIAPGGAQIADLQHVRFDRALALLREIEPAARVTLDTVTGLATKIDGRFQIDLPPDAKSQPESEQAAAAAVLFVEHFGSLFGVPGWHSLQPVSASPLGRSTWFHFDARTFERETVRISVCADARGVSGARVEPRGLRLI